ncbi:MAG: hypothetical protein IPG99_19470 [Ignavibacteria bacterium]|nr:hypothetical protein [Ignavibacteria bacterium]
MSEDGQGWKGEMGIFDDRHIEGLSRLSDGIFHEYGSLGIVQIFTAVQEVRKNLPVNSRGVQVHIL